MMVLDHVGDQEAMVYAQLGQQPLARTTETPPELRLGTLSCLSARPPDLATATAAQPEVDWCACGRAIDCPISILQVASARRRRDPRVRVMDDRPCCRRYERTTRGTTHTRTHQEPRAPQRLDIKKTP